MEATLTYKNVAWEIHGCHKPLGTKCVLVKKWECQVLKMIYVQKSPHILIALAFILALALIFTFIFTRIIIK